jgi:hypothetical protein
MKPRIEKKLSKALAAIFAGTKLGKDIWIDNEWYRETHFSLNRSELTPKQRRYNNQCRVAVSHVPSLGGEADYWGEGSDYASVSATYENWARETMWYAPELFDLSHRYSDQPALTEAETLRLAVLTMQVKRLSARIRNGRHLLAHARGEASVMRFKEGIRADQLAASKARWAAEAVAKRLAEQNQPQPLAQ